MENWKDRIQTEAHLEVDFEQLVHQKQHAPLLRVLYSSTAMGKQFFLSYIANKMFISQNKLPKQINILR